MIFFNLKCGLTLEFLMMSLNFNPRTCFFLFLIYFAHFFSFRWSLYFCLSVSFSLSLSLSLISLSLISVCVCLSVFPCIVSLRMEHLAAVLFTLVRFYFAIVVIFQKFFVIYRRYTITHTGKKIEARQLEIRKG